MSLLSQATVGTVGLLCKTFLKIGCSSVTVNGLEHLYGALESDERNQGRGVVTGEFPLSFLHGLYPEVATQCRTTYQRTKSPPAL